MSALQFTVVVDGNGVYKATEWLYLGSEPAGTNPEYYGSSAIQDLLNTQAERIAKLEAALGTNCKPNRIVD